MPFRGLLQRGLLRSFEVWLVARLLASPTFHRMVGRVHGQIQRLRHGIPPEEMGGIKRDSDSRIRQFIQYFREEIKDQFKSGKPPNKL